MRTAFFGTPAIAVPALTALAAMSDVRVVICQPDKPAGRGLAVAHPAVKARALELGLRVEQPTKVKVPEFAASLRELELDVAVVMAYGRILPKGVLDAPRLGCINLHASLLPKYRGAAPITWSVVHGDARTGVALMQMDEGMDTGPVFTMREVPIGPDATAGDVSELLAACAATMVTEDLPRAIAGELVAQPQDHDAATHAPMLSKEDGKIDWSQPAPRVHDHVRGMSPWPGAWTRIEGKLFKVLETRRSPPGPPAAPGTIVVADKGRIEIACGQAPANGRVELVRAQLEGKKAHGAVELVAGRTIRVGMVLGEPAAAHGAPT
jgi:methionyl-tRNA formyltransferase